MAEFQLIRPLWLLALLPLAWLLYRLWRRRARSRGWQAVVDPALLPHLLIDTPAGRGHPWGLAAAGLAGLLAVVALAGPVWQKIEQPVFRTPSALVVLFDLSRSMEAADLAPSRLARARLKLRELLARRQEGQTALVVFAGQPFVMSPLTTDSRTIDSQVEALASELMPAQGSRPDLAISKAEELLRQGGVRRGAVLLITDGMDQPEVAEGAARRLAAAGHRLAVLGVGTAQGAPIPQQGGGFVQDAGGGIVLPRLEGPPLSRLAEAGNGLYREITPDDRDLEALLTLAAVDRTAAAAGQESDPLKTDLWREEGPWLLLPLLALALLGFRRGQLWLLALILIAPLPRPAAAFDWSSLWQRPDQQAARALAQGDATRAAELFEDPAWRAAAAYKAGDYEGALKALEGRQDPESLYNRGNALARLGKLPEAKAAYEEALKQAPGHGDAEHNRRLMEELMKKGQPQPNESSGADGEKDQKQQGARQQQGQSQQQQGAGQEESPGKGEGSTGDSQTQKPEAAQNRSASGQAGEQPPAADESQAQPTKPDGQGEPGDGREEEATAATPGHQREGETPPPQAGTGEQAEAAPQPQDPQTGAEASPEQAATSADPAAALADGDPNAREQGEAARQWLRRIPDDPAALWRRKFLHQYRQQPGQPGDERKPW